MTTESRLNLLTSSIWTLCLTKQVLQGMGNLIILETNQIAAIPLYSCFLEAMTVNEFFKDKTNFTESDFLFMEVDWYNKQHEPMVSDKFKAEAMKFAETERIVPFFSISDKSVINPKKNIFIEDKVKIPPASKLVATYLIQINNEKKFQVTMRIIGAKGANMKRIVSEVVGKRRNKDLFKLRLRGKGSGFKEGPDNAESEDELQLCLSAKFDSDFQHGKKLVEELLGKIYRDYDQFFRRQGKKSPQLKVKQGNN